MSAVTMGDHFTYANAFPVALRKKTPLFSTLANGKPPTAVSEPWVGQKTIRRVTLDPKRACVDKAASNLQETEKGKVQPE